MSGGFDEEKGGLLPPAHTYYHHHHHQKEAYNTNESSIGRLDQDSEDQAAAAVVEREHMFDKVVTPSDVGKLNRLVIPKQHAEKYFPLDSSANEKGLLLSFEDRHGKPWRFRYSYWNSSQSYVMTKGWSRFVKDKKLDAGDIVSFARAKDRLFIDWRRRGPVPLPPPLLPTLQYHHFSWNPYNYPTLLQRPHHQSRSHHQYHQYPSCIDGNPCSNSSGSILCFRSEPEVQRGNNNFGVVVDERMVFDSVPVVQAKAAGKRLRLFGVTMDCPISEPDNEECDIVPSKTVPMTIHQFESSLPINLIPSLQLRPYNHDVDDKGKRSMPLDLDI